MTFSLDKLQDNTKAIEAMMFNNPDFIDYLAKLPPQEIIVIGVGIRAVDNFLAISSEPGRTLSRNFIKRQHQAMMLRETH